MEKRENSIYKKKILVFAILGMFLFLFVLQFVSAANPIGDWFAKWDDGNLSPNIAKYLFWILIAIIVYGIADAIPGLEGPGKAWLRGLLAIIVGFLAMAYITPDEVYVLMTSYSALGFILGGLLPFIILAAFTFRLASKAPKSKPGQRLMNKALAWVAWGAFALFLAYKNFMGGGEAYGNNPTLSLLHWIMFGLSILMLITIGWVFAKIGKLSLHEDIGAIKDNIQLAKEGRRANIEEARAAAEA